MFQFLLLAPPPLSRLQHP